MALPSKPISLNKLFVIEIFVAVIDGEPASLNIVIAPASVPVIVFPVISRQFISVRPSMLIAA